MKIAFIGLGHMGQPMARNLIKAGHQLHVYDVMPVARKAMENHGVIACSSIAEAVCNAEVVFTMLQTGEQVKACCLGADGIFNHIVQTAIYIDCSSIDIQDSRELHREAEKIKIAMLDAPVSGGVKGAQSAQLTFMVGGKEENFIRAKSILELLGKHVIYAGAAGNGQAAKICNNMILGVSMIAVSEAFKLGEKLGLDAKTFHQIANNASGQCWVLSHYCPMPGIMENVPSSNDYKPGFTAAMMLKDLKLSQTAATAARVKTVLGAKATEMYKQYVDAGNAEIDFSGIIQWI